MWQLLTADAGVREELAAELGVLLEERVLDPSDPIAVLEKPLGKKHPALQEEAWRSFDAKFREAARRDLPLRDLIAAGDSGAPQGIEERTGVIARELARWLEKAPSSKLFGDVSAETIEGAGNVVAGIQQIIHLHAEPAAESAGEDPRTVYLQRLIKKCRQLPLDALSEAGGLSKLRLDQVYVDLDTTTQVGLEPKENKRHAKRPRRPAIEGTDPREQRRLSAREAAREEYLVLLGQPGSGKSSFAKHLLSEMAEALLDEGKPWPEGFPEGLLPVYVRLKDVAALLPEDVARRSGEPRNERLLRAFHGALDRALGDWQAGDFRDTLHRQLEREPCFLVLDGLDEVAEGVRPLVRDVVVRLREELDRCRLLVTCRVRSYRGKAVLEGVPTHTLAPFDEERIACFVELWYRSQDRYDGSEERRRIADLKKAALSEDLKELSENPLLLTTMAGIHQRDVGLPKERVRLYSRAVEILLVRWQEQSTGELPERLRDLLKETQKLRMALEQLALLAHQKEQQAGSGGRQRKRTAATALPRGEVLARLEKKDLLGKAGLASEFLDYADQRAGLLQGEGGEDDKPSHYVFPHRSFQEYLAGCALFTGRDRRRDLLELAKQADFWSLAVELGAEELLYVRAMRDVLLDLAYDLLQEHKDSQSAEALRAFLWSGKIAALFGPEEVGDDDGRPQGGKKYLRLIKTRLARACGGTLTAAERADSGRALGALGDPRRGVLEVEEMELCWVPAGELVLGSEEERWSVLPEQPQEKHALDYGHWIARWPVTQAQFHQFVEDGGYQDDCYWSATRAQAGRGGGLQLLVDPKRALRQRLGPPLSDPNLPRCEVSWYEAAAFCRWLSQRLDPAGRCGKGWAFALPSELEWEKAARGGVEIPEQVVRRSYPEVSGPLEEVALQANPGPVRDYPWQGDATERRLNSLELGLLSPTTPGCFPDGDSPYGCGDLSGNVWEWTRSLAEEYPYPSDGAGRRKREDVSAPREQPRVLRGGSFLFNARSARCSYRYNARPDLANDLIGFRVVLLPYSDL